jgi:hypothetical protein
MLFHWFQTPLFHYWFACIPVWRQYIANWGKDALVNLIDVLGHGIR